MGASVGKLNCSVVEDKAGWKKVGDNYELNLLISASDCNKPVTYVKDNVNYSIIYKPDPNYRSYISTPVLYFTDKKGTKCINNGPNKNTITDQYNETCCNDNYLKRYAMCNTASKCNNDDIRHVSFGDGGYQFCCSTSNSKGGGQFCNNNYAGSSTYIRYLDKNSPTTGILKIQDNLLSIFKKKENYEDKKNENYNYIGVL